MPNSDERQVLSYYKPPFSQSWVTGWDWTLFLVVMGTIFVWPRLMARSRPTPELDAVLFASWMVALRGAIAVLRRDRSLWWLPYLLLFVSLPSLAYAVVEFWQTPSGQRIGIGMYRFWRGLP